ncbi:hypothetical protein M2459_001103 [Parabacteroides sp. PF5-5]|nr:hypothetical protein [Parabacteroides sp. PH5-39]MDH6315477.1 hypothetical protein [Parabacteroides sp. PF5-13]MDH6319029.1 hypothetical protein [Parabacteroides sp. PH5-13]MDH6322759.1 hypothetical protein [Parabacteroides sp. PH5-8]MDH6326669.1 hypothetical protein [Parabacteroides sp. PH5-41]MDH6334361.1 hypothetical protein [Parabacteroides sp. PF5-5]MDH6345534.1 hypothetical protein [Parabacteroides sp. PH5-46]MDH6360490.1 hypothetical protein [Parabacteroides sp. PH5-16]MDH6376049.
MRTACSVLRAAAYKTTMPNLQIKTFLVSKPYFAFKYDL